MKKSIYIRSLVVFAGMLAASCAEDYKETIPMPDMPASVGLDKRLASYGLLTDYAAEAGITLGVGVTADEFSAQGLTFGIVRNNFTQIESASRITPFSSWTTDNTFDLSPLSTLAGMAAQNELDLFGPVLCSETDIPDDYLKSLIADEVIPYEPWSEQLLVSDFEDDAIGTKYPSQKKAAASSGVTVVEDPLGQQGKVLGGVKLTMDVPMVANFKLPEGATLADLSRLRVKCLLTSGTPTASRIQILSAGNNEKGNPYTVKNEWQDFVFDLTTIKFSDTDINANTISIAVGCYGSNIICYIDEIYVQLEHRKGDDTVIAKTPEEKTAIIGGELDKWVNAVTTATGTAVKKFVIFDDPLDAELSSFHWADYLGDGYMKNVQDSVIKAAGSDVRFYLSQSMTLGEMMPIDVTSLKTEITRLENKGVKVDGVNVVLDAVYYEDYSTQLAQDAYAVDAIRSLAKLGKPVRVSNFRVRMVDTNGAQLDPTKAITTVRRQAVAEYYELVISEFVNALGSNAESFSISGVTDNAANIAPWLTDGNRNFVYEGIVNGLTK